MCECENEGIVCRGPGVVLEEKGSGIRRTRIRVWCK